MVRELAYVPCRRVVTFVSQVKAFQPVFSPLLVFLGLFLPDSAFDDRILKDVWLR